MRRIKSTHDIEQRVLTSTVRADHRENLARIDRKSDAIDRDQAAEGNGKILDQQDAHAARRLRSEYAAGTIPEGRKIRNAIMIAPRTMCS